MFKPKGRKTVQRYPIRICFIGLGRHSAFKKCVNGGHSFTELLFTSMGNLAKLAENAGGGWLPF